MIRIYFFVWSFSLLVLGGCGGGNNKNGIDVSPSRPSTGGASNSSSSSSSNSSASSSGRSHFEQEYLSGGASSTNRFDENAFSQSPPEIALDFNLDAIFKQGNFLFRSELKGIGPLLNNRSCQGCHIKDGRGNPPLNPQETFSSMLLKFSLGNDADNKPIPDPVYGTQYQSYGLSEFGELLPARYEAALDNASVVGEAHAWVEYEEVAGTYADGRPYSLRRPTYYLSQAAWGEFSTGLLISPRVASPMIGLGLLGAIPESELLLLADEDDSDGDGISGRARFVHNPTCGQTELGRYGWKASTGSVLQQSSNAFKGDLGLTNIFSIEEDCSPLQLSCAAMAENEVQSGESPDVDALVLASVEFYSRLLAVPERRGFDGASERWDENIAAGTKIFTDIGCAACHVRHFKTGDAAPSVLGQVVSLSRLEPGGEPIDVLSQQDIWPHTNLLLHDMGGTCEPLVRENNAGQPCSQGEDCYWVQRCEGLADGRPDGTASGTEWRTAPLWGIGLTQTVNPNAGFLHDGRARSIEEAILWHGGEGEASKNAFVQLTVEERAQLLAFLNSL